MIDVAAHLDASATVGVLARFYNPHAVTVSGVLYQLGLILRILIHLEKLLEFPVVFTFFDMECERHVVKWIQAKRFIIDLHIVPNSLLVAQMEVIFLVICRDHMMASMVLFLLVLFILVLAADSNLARGLVSA